MHPSSTYPTNTTHMFNPDNKYNINKMRKEARKRLEKGRSTIIHSHTATKSECNDNCEKYEPEQEEDND